MWHQAMISLLLQRYFYLSSQLSIRLVYTQSVQSRVRTEIRFSPTCLVKTIFMFLYRFFVVFALINHWTVCFETSFEQTIKIKPSCEFRDCIVFLFFLTSKTRKKIFSLQIGGDQFFIISCCTRGARKENKVTKSVIGRWFCDGKLFAKVNKSRVVGPRTTASPIPIFKSICSEKSKSNLRQNR